MINVYANSNYGRALRQFVDRSLEAVTSRTTVIIIGDGRSNYFPPETWTLERIRGRARHVLWLKARDPGFVDVRRQRDARVPAAHEPGRGCSTTWQLSVGL